MYVGGLERGEAYKCMWVGTRGGGEGEESPECSTPV